MNPLQWALLAADRPTFKIAQPCGRKPATPAARESPVAVNAAGNPKGENYPQISPSDEIACRERGGKW
jgi:hypothetical protein